jgi:membrane fusion protein, multidrug efflux system
MRRVVLILLCLLVAGGGAYWWFVLRAPGTQQARGRRTPDAIPVLAATATTRDVPIYLDGLGTVQASAMVTVKPMVDGPLVEVDFREGQDVKVGDVLARIDPRSYQAAFDQAVAKKRQDEATLANARLDLVRYQKLAATAYTSAQQADTQKALVAQLEAQVAQDQAQIDSARTQLSYTTITSPVDGRVGIRQIDAGNIVHAADVVGLTAITTLKPISVLFTLPQQNLQAVAAAMAAGTPEVLALPQSGSGTQIMPSASSSRTPTAVGAAVSAPPTGTSAKPLDRGTLTVLDNQVDPSTGTIKLKATFPNDKLLLWPGAFVTVRLKVETRHDAVVVPPVAVQRGPRGAYVYVINDNQTVTRRPVTVGHEDLDASLIAEGLKSGEEVVTDGAARLTDNAKVNVLPPPGANPPPAAPATPDATTPSASAPNATAAAPGPAGHRPGAPSAAPSEQGPVARVPRNRGNS